MFEAYSTAAPIFIIPWWFWLIVAIMVVLTAFIFVISDNFGLVSASISISICLLIYFFAIVAPYSDSLTSYHDQVAEYYKANVATYYDVSLVDSNDTIYLTVGSNEDDTWTSENLNCITEDGLAKQVKLIANNGVVSLYDATDSDGSPTLENAKTYEKLAEQ